MNDYEMSKLIKKILYFSIEEVTFLICGCKGSTFSRTYQTFM